MVVIHCCAIVADYLAQTLIENEMEEKNKLTVDYLESIGFEIIRNDMEFSTRIGDFKIWKGSFDKFYTWQYSWVNMTTGKIETVDILTKSHLRELFFSLYQTELELITDV